jgi:hypothetical protein
MSLRVTLAAFVAISTLAGASAALASPVYSENFNAAGFVGSSIGAAGIDATSDRWANTDYFLLNDFDGWTFAGGAYLAQNRGTSDGALLLNENGGVATTLIGLTAGQTYTFSLLLSGDNRQGQAYVFDATLDGVLHSIGGIDLAPGANPGSIFSFDFTASSASASLVLSQSTPRGSEASPIVDNITITQAAGGVPEPATWALMLSGFGMAGAALRRRRAAYRLVEIAADGSRTVEEFPALDDRSALQQALAVAEGVAIELWHGARLVLRREVSEQVAA